MGGVHAGWPRWQQPALNPVRNGDLAYSNCLTDIVNKTHIAADGQINTAVVLDDPDGYLTGILDDTASGAQPLRLDVPPALDIYRCRFYREHGGTALYQSMSIMFAKDVLAPPTQLPI